MSLARQVSQPHGGDVFIVDDLAQPENGLRPEADALITRLAQVPIVIRVADCGPVYFF